MQEALENGCDLRELVPVVLREGGREGRKEGGREG